MGNKTMNWYSYVKIFNLIFIVGIFGLGYNVISSMSDVVGYSGAGVLAIWLALHLFRDEIERASQN